MGILALVYYHSGVHQISNKLLYKLADRVFYFHMIEKVADNGYLAISYFIMETIITFTSVSNVYESVNDYIRLSLLMYVDYCSLLATIVFQFLFSKFSQRMIDKYGLQIDHIMQISSRIFSFTSLDWYCLKYGKLS